MKYLLFVFAFYLSVSNSSDQCEGTEVEISFIGLTYPEEANWVVNKGVAYEVEPPITLAILEGEWVNSWSQPINCPAGSLTCTISTTSETYTFEIVETEDSFMINDWVLDKSSTTLHWDKGFESVFWSKPSEGPQCETKEGELTAGMNTETCCLKTGHHRLHCLDVYHDGWHGAYVQINGHVYCHNFLDGHEQIEKFAIPIRDNVINCEDYTISVFAGEKGGPYSWAFNDTSCASYEADPEDGSTAETVCCLPAGSHTLSCVSGFENGWDGGYLEVDGNRYCQTFAGTQSVHMVDLGGGKASDKCLDGEIWVPIEMHTSVNAGLISWEINENCKGDNYQDQSHYHSGCCLEANQEYTLACESYEELGWLGGILKVQGKWYCYKEEFTTHTESVYIHEQEPQMPNPEGCSNLQIGVYSMAYATTIRWEIEGTNCRSTGEGSKHFEVTCCLVPEVEYTIRCVDTSYSGWKGYISIGHNDYCSNIDVHEFVEEQFVAHKEPTCNLVTVSMHSASYDHEHSWSIDNGDVCQGFAHTAEDVVEKQCCISPGWHRINCADNDAYYGYGYGYGYWYGYGGYGSDGDDDDEDTEYFGWGDGYLEIEGQKYCEDFESGTAYIDMGCIGGEEYCNTGTYSCDIIVKRAGGCRDNERLVTKGEAQRCIHQVCDDVQAEEMGQLDGGYLLGLTTGCSIEEMTTSGVVCRNDDTVVDQDGDTCSGYYDYYPSECGRYDTDTFTASEACCVCNGGNNADGPIIDPNFSLCVHNTLDDECVDVEIVIHSTFYGNEIVWQVDDGSTCKGNNYPDNTVITETCCLGENTHTITCIDTMEDSWHGSYITIDGKVMCQEMNNWFGTIVSEEFAVGQHTNIVNGLECVDVEFQVDIAEDDYTNMGFGWYVTDDESCHDAEGTNYGSVTCCLRRGPHTLSCLTSAGRQWSENTKISVNGEVLCENVSEVHVMQDFTVSESECPDGTLHADINTYVTSYGDEVFWSVDDIAECRGTNFVNEVLHSTSCCLAPGEHTINCHDKYGDGWLDSDEEIAYVEINGERFCENFRFDFLLSEKFRVENSQCYYHGYYSTGAVLNPDVFDGRCSPFEREQDAYECADACLDNDACEYWHCGENRCVLLSTNGLGIQYQHGIVGGPKGCRIRTSTHLGPSTSTTRDPNRQCTDVDIEVHPQYFGHELVWKIEDNTGNLVCSGEGHQSFEIEKSTCCLDANENHNLICEGTDGTGWNLGYIIVDTEMYCDWFHVGYENDPVPFQVGNEPKTTEGGCINIDIFMETYMYGDEISWTIDDGACSGSGYGDDQVGLDICCLAPGEHTLKCVDWAFDGWHWGFITIDGVAYCQDFLTGASATRTFTISADQSHDTQRVESYHEFSRCQPQDFLTEEECRYVSEEDGKTLYVEHGDDYPHGCYVYDSYYYYNINEVHTYCHWTDFCVCKGQDHNTHERSTYEPLVNPNSIAHYSSYGDACGQVLTYTECLSLSDTHVYSLNTYDAPYGCYKYQGNTYYNIHMTNIRCDSYYFSEECLCKSPRPPVGPGIYIIERGSCPVVPSLDDCDNAAAQDNEQAWEVEGHGYPYGCHRESDGTHTFYYFNYLPNAADCTGVECLCHEDYTADNTPITFDDSCESNNDGVCDLPPYCAPHTDCTDCGTCGVGVPPELDFDPFIVSEGKCEEYLTMAECQSVAGNWDISTIDDGASPGGCFYSMGTYTFNNRRRASETACSRFQMCYCKTAPTTTTTALPFEYVSTTSYVCGDQLTRDECESLSESMFAADVMQTESVYNFPPGCYNFAGYWFYNYEMEADQNCNSWYVCYCKTVEIHTGVSLKLTEGDYGALLAKVDAGSWGFVCADKFLDNSRGPKAACISMGYTNSNAVAYHQLKVDYNIRFAIDDVECGRGVTDINDCLYNADSHNCYNDEAVWLECSDNFQIDLQLDPESDSESAGILLASVNGGQQGYVCDDIFNFDDSAAKVACRQLGLPFISVKMSSVQSSKMAVVLDRVNCDGSEDRLDKCQYSLDGTMCDDYTVVYIDCAYRKPVGIDLLLTDGTNPNNGYIMASIDGAEYGNICGDAKTTTMKAADVMCRQLGYGSASSMHNVGMNTRHYVLDAIKCDGTESNIIDCEFNENHDCSAGEAIYIECQEEEGSTKTPVKPTEEITTTMTPIQGSCAQHHCGAYVEGSTCQCDLNCVIHNNCCIDYDALCAIDVQQNLVVDKVEEQWLLYELAEFKDLLALHLRVLPNRIYITSPKPDATRRRLTATTIAFTVYCTDTIEAMRVQNDLVDSSFITLIQSEARHLKGWEVCKISGPTGSKRNNCQLKTGTIAKGSAISNTKATTLDECTMDCITRVSSSLCVGYNFDPNGSVKCVLLSEVSALEDSSSPSSVMGLCLTTDQDVSKIPVDGQPITIDDESNVGDDDDDDDDNSDSAIVAIILTAIVLVIIFSLMTYCAYVYGKNKRMQEESKTAPHDDFPISAHQLNSAEIIAEQRLFEQAVAANNAANNTQYKRSVEHSGAIQVIQDPETGSSHNSSLGYIAAQPPITSSSSTPSKPPPQPSNPLPAPTKQGPPPSYNADDDDLHGVSSDVKETKGGSIYEEEEESP